jgi:hypothetical protein
MSTGYFLPKSVDDVSRLANLTDMVMRAQMNLVKPLSVYMVDPNVGVSLTAFRDKLEQISWIGEEGNDAESRALGRNLSQSLVPERVHFVAVRALITAPPERLLATVQKNFPAGITCKDLTKEVFCSLRGVSQTHLMPKIWAANMYVSLQAFDEIKDVSSISKLNSPLMNIFNLFDVPKFIETYSFAILARYYKKYVGIMLEAAKEKVLNGKDYVIPEEPITSSDLSLRVESLMEYLEKLKTFLPHDASRYNVVLTAAAAGIAVYDVFKANVKDFPEEKEAAAAPKKIKLKIKLITK